MAKQPQILELNPPSELTFTGMTDTCHCVCTSASAVVVMEKVKVVLASESEIS